MRPDVSLEVDDCIILFDLGVCVEYFGYGSLANIGSHQDRVVMTDTNRDV